MEATRTRILGSIDRHARDGWKPAQLRAYVVDGDVLLKVEGGNTLRLDPAMQRALSAYLQPS